MAYVRRRGNQLAIVHGVRNPATKQVEQDTLFTIYSKAEALAAVEGQRDHFRQILQTQAPAIRFDWKKVDAQIREHLDHLPDLYLYKDERIERSFRSALCEFTRELVLADPQFLYSSALTLQRHRHELSYLRDLIDWRLELAEQEPSDWNQDNPFYWRSRSHRQEVPPEQWERLSTLYEQNKHDEAAALAKLLTECWPNFARGFNYLGLIALRRERLQEALAHFDEAIRVGRSGFPKRIRKEMYWSDHDTRPYIRAIIHKARTLNRMERFDEALELCDRLETECGQDVAAAIERASIGLNCGDWLNAITAARHVSSIHVELDFLLGFALFETGEHHEALVHLVHASLSCPRTGRILAGLRTRSKPKTYIEVEDHNSGVELHRDLQPFLQKRGAAAVAFLSEVLTAREVVILIEEGQEATRRHYEGSGGDRAAFDRMMQMRSIDFAREQAGVVARAIGGLEGRGSAGQRRVSPRRGRRRG